MVCVSWVYGFMIVGIVQVVSDIRYNIPRWWWVWFRLGVASDSVVYSSLNPPEPSFGGIAVCVHVCISIVGVALIPKSICFFVVSFVV